jgi:hypothetical protein
MAENKFMGRIVKEHITFLAEGTFESLYEAQGWLHTNGYSHGSLCRDMPVAIKDGLYDLPQKWKNFDTEDEELIDGVMVSNDFREAQVEVYIFN